MNMFYHVPRAVYDANRPKAWHHSLYADDGETVLVVVEGWQDWATQKAWEELPGVVEYPIWTWHQPVSALFVRAHGPSAGVHAGHSIGEAFRKVRATWPAAREHS